MKHSFSEASLTKNAIISQLSKSPHGDLNTYVSVGQAAAEGDAEFYAHLIAWNLINGEIRDSKVALPVVSLSTKMFPRELEENSLAHLVLLDPKMLLAALRFANQLKLHPRRRDKVLKTVVEKYLRAREADTRWFDRAALQNRSAMKSLYAYGHVKPNERARAILFSRKPPHGSVFHKIQQLKDMAPAEAAGTILNLKIPFLVVQGALGAKIKDPDIAMAMIQHMSAAEITNNMNLLKKLGVTQSPVLKAALDEALQKVATPKQLKTVKVSTRASVAPLKISKAIDAVDDERLKAKLQAAQEQHLNSMKGIDGNWLVLGDKSGSMAEAIETSRRVAGVLSKLVRGKVHLVFFDVSPRYLDATGKTYEEIVAQTKFVQAGGGTSIGCGLIAAVDKGAEIDGIVIISDGAENSQPMFSHAYKALVTATGKQIPVYLYRVSGRGSFQDVDISRSMAAAGFDLQEFDLRGGVDYYSIPNLVQTMRSNRYSLIDEIMETPLLTLDEVFK